MAAALLAMACLADSLAEVEIAELSPSWHAANDHRTLLAFPTASAAARSLQRWRVRHPFARAALDVVEAAEPPGTADASGAPSALTDLTAAARPGEVVVSEVGYLLLRAVDEFAFERCGPPLDGARRLLPPPPATPPLPLPSLLALTDRHPFVARSEPWAVLERAWAAAGATARRAVLVEGEAGSGKTRLVTEFARRAASEGAIVLYGGSTDGVELPFQPFSEALRPAFETLCLAGAPAALDTDRAEDLALLFPWARAAVPTRPVADGTRAAALPRGPETDRHWAFEAVVDLLDDLSRRAAVLLVLDDAHWAQRPTLRLLEHVMRSGRLSRLCVLVTARSTPADRTDAFAESLSTIVRLPGVDRVALDRFDEVAVRRFVAEATGSSHAELPASFDAVVRQLAEGSGGNAFLLAESWQHLVETRRVRRTETGWSVHEVTGDDTPRSVREMVAQRVAKLGHRARRVLELAACAGIEFDAGLLAGATGEDLDTVFDALCDAAAAGLLVETTPGRGHFVHALVRQALEDSLGALDRARHHRALGGALDARQGAEPAAVARHDAAAVPLVAPAVVARRARTAAQRSLETVSFDDAVAVLQLALGLVQDPADRADLLIDLAAVHARAGDALAAVRGCDEAAAIARQGGDQPRLVRAARQLSEATWRGALHGGAAVSLLREALAGEIDEHTRCELLAALSGAFALCGEDEANYQASDEAIALAQRLEHPRLLMDAIHSRLYAMVLPHNVDEQLAASLHGLEVAQRESDEFSELRLLCKVMLRLFVRGDPQRLARCYERLELLVKRFRQPYYLLVQAGNAATVALAEGRFDDAEAAAQRYAGWAEVNHQDDGTSGILMFSIRREQGRLAELRPLLELAARLGRTELSWAPGLAAVYSEAEMFSEATAVLDRLAEDNLASLPSDSLLPGVLSFLADAADLCGHRTMARLVLPRLAPYSGLLVYVPGLACYGAADRYLGRLHDTLGQPDRASAAFERALQLDLRCGWSTWIAHSQFALGRHLLRRAGRDGAGRAKDLLAAAQATAGELGMAALHRRALAALAELPAGSISTAATLTPREREVLSLLCEGRSNRQIGDALNASQHTIANHVRSILAKTGAANRTEAAAWAHRHGELV